MAYPVELREKALEAYEKGVGSQEKVARLFGLGISTFKRWVKKQNAGEDLNPPITRSGRPKKITASGREMIKNLVEANPSITLSELSEAYYEVYKEKLSVSMICRELKLLNLRYKKLSLYAAEKCSDKIKKKEQSTGQP